LKIETLDGISMGGKPSRVGMLGSWDVGRWDIPTS
jgi:hypothetical protein